ncbi:MAG: NADH-quinone oxidoreductase subunit J [Planctomycetes bacterium]|nr:NADH-quinone oxidoreductase subunit J [Planctomycetota bacterium]
MFTPSANWVYCIIALGALGIYFLLPRTDRNTRTAGAVLALAALAGLAGFGMTRFPSADSTAVYFYVFSAIALVCAVCVITQTRAIYSALYFVVTVLAVAGLVLLLGAEFLAAALIIVYGGAILVTYVFVIMLASQSGEVLYDRRSRGPLGACFTGFLLVATIGGLMMDKPSAGGDVGIASAAPAVQAEPRSSLDASTQVMGNTESVGVLLMTRYVVVLELAGVLLLLAMVGAIAIAQKKFPADEALAASKKVKIGEKGKTAAPF